MKSLSVSFLALLSSFFIFDKMKLQSELDDFGSDFRAGSVVLVLARKLLVLIPLSKILILQSSPAQLLVWIVFSITY